MPPAPVTLSLEKILHSQGFGSRKHCRLLVLHGDVRVDGRVVDDPATALGTANLSFTVQGQAWTFHAKAYLMMHKPKHHECSHKPHHHPSVYTLLPRPLVTRGVQCIGRLDEDTTGLLLLSDDGAFIHRLSSPKHKVPKVYAVTCKHPVTADQLDALRHGVQLVDEPRPLAALAAAAGPGEHELSMTLAQGKYHQVKRMMAAVGNRVDALKRTHIGVLALPETLTPGQWAFLSQSDVACLWPAHGDAGLLAHETETNERNP
jgi:16S rRNA pseudouridine516 synthase